LSSDAISPVDGRYYEEVKELAAPSGERELFYRRIYVELKYLEALLASNALGFKAELHADEVIGNIGNDWFSRVKELEAELGHDVKASEVFTRDLAGRFAPYVHLGLTSDDVNSIAIGLIYLNVRKIIAGRFRDLVSELSEIARKEASTVMMARTHGVPAVPTTFGKEMATYAWRISQALSGMCSEQPYGKLSGAVGSYNSFCIINSEFDWVAFSRSFVESLGLRFPESSKQVAPYEGLSDSLHYLMQLNMIIVELARDLWMYNMLGLVRLERKGVSSSTMPHKVNPVDLEDAEGQARISNQLLYLIAYEIIPTRLQRDLTDSTVRRNLWLGIAHSYIAAGRLIKSLKHMNVDRGKMLIEVSAHSEALSEAVQVALRAQGHEKGYEEVWQNIDRLEELKAGVTGELGERLRKLRPEDYVGLSERLAVSVAEKAVKTINC
jgi:adenylosuccinate lyase